MLNCQSIKIEQCTDTYDIKESTNSISYFLCFCILYSSEKSTDSPRNIISEKSEYRNEQDYFCLRIFEIMGGEPRRSQ